VANDRVTTDVTEQGKLENRFEHLEVECGWLRMEDSSFLKVTILAEFIRPTTLPARSSNSNAFAERWMKSIKDDCLSKLTLFGKTSLRRGLREYPLAQAVLKKSEEKFVGQFEGKFVGFQPVFDLANILE